MFAPVTTELTTGGRPLRIHLVSTGMGRDKTRFREARLHNKGSILDAILDRRFTGWLPIWVMVIEHPEGIFLIDTGLDPAINQPDYFKTSGFPVHRYIRSQFQFAIDEDQAILRQLATLNISPKNIEAIILTHLHFDHIGGLRHFPGTPVLLNKTEWEHPFGALPKLYPPGFNPTLVSLNTPIDEFAKAHYLTTTNDLALVHAPGHTPGHCSVLLHTDSGHILFAGDVCYDKNQLENGKFAANLASYPTAKQTYQTIRAFARQHRLLFLPSHDPEAGARLTQRAWL